MLYHKTFELGPHDQDWVVFVHGCGQQLLHLVQNGCQAYREHFNDAAAFGPSWSARLTSCLGW